MGKRKNKKDDWVREGKKRHWKQNIKALFGKKSYVIDDSELGKSTEVTVGKRKTKFKGPGGKRIVKGKEKEGVDKMFQESFGYKKGGFLNYKKGGIIQHD
jgi:hypothetical protein|tara:strand:- start:24263 stop:24562 length:300 start_codon:yes stop_codon:yes gene_type:complete